jgi:ATP-binding cassette, subfamily B, bacterial PglK
VTARAPVAAGPHEGLLALLARLWRLLGPRRRRQFRLLMLLVIASALAEVVSLGAVLPFLAVLASPEAAFAHPFGTAVATRLEITSPQGLMLPLTLAFVVAALVSGAIRLLLLKASTRFAFGTGSELSIEVYRRTLYQPYSVHVSRNSSQVISGITQKVGGTTMGVLMPTVTLISSGVAILALMLALIAINPAVALAATTCFGLSYAAITWRARRRLRRNSVLIAREQTELVKALQEGLGGIRDVLLDGTQAVYCEAYGRADRPLRRAQGANVFIAQSPRYSIEALGMVLIAVLAYALSRQAGGLSPALPLLGALAIGAQRLLPSLQQAFSAWANIAGNQGVLRDSLELLEQPVARELELPPPAPLPFTRSIRFDRIRFRYSERSPWVIEGLSLEIPKGARIGFVGSTGGGKSTTLDLLMGLLMPTEGEILVDGEPVRGERVRAWQRTLAHVPQSIFLADSTLAENIAFGVPRDAIDSARVHDAAERAQLARFIENHPEGYDAMVGERGIRLSGGQRQRIGIARALYKNASVLVLDEATSALDNVTEQSVLDAIDALDRELTILLIAHRLTTVRRCDVIIELEQGAIVAQGTYEELLERSPSFRRMVESTRIN